MKNVLKWILNIIIIIIGLPISIVVSIIYAILMFFRWSLLAFVILVLFGATENEVLMYAGSFGQLLGIFFDIRSKLKK